MKTKQEQIEEMQKVICDNCKDKYPKKGYVCPWQDRKTKCYKCENLSEALYNAGYRKTFTRDLASDTQKAFKEGYEKGCETCVQAWDNGYNDGYGSGKEDGVREFAEKVKGKSEMFLVAKGDGVYGEKLYVSIEEIDELLKEYF